MTDQPKSLFQKVWDAHRVRELPSGQTQLLIGTHLIHEVTSPQAFAMLRELGLPVRFPNRTFATVDHIIPTDDQSRPLADDLAEAMMSELERNCRDHGITFFGPETGAQGIVHVIGPELGLTQPGMTIACGDSHTSTHGAFGAIAFGIGTSQVRDLLATQSMAMAKLKVRRIEVTGKLRPGVYAKDVILAIIRKLGVNGGVGYAYEYAGPVLDAMSIEERMTVCNMSIEGGARCGYVNPDVHDRRVPARPPLYARRRALRGQGRRLARDGERPGLPLRRRGRDRRRRDRALGHLGHPPGPQSRRQRVDPDPQPGAATTSARASRKPSSTWTSRPAPRSQVRRSTSPSSARAPTAGSRTCARPRAWRKTGHVKPGVRALVVPGSMAVQQAGRGRGTRRDLPRRRASSGGSRAARCAWR